jgi:hypothetical protein
LLATERDALEYTDGLVNTKETSLPAQEKDQAFETQKEQRLLQLQEVGSKQRKVAEKRAFDHIIKVGKNQCLAYDVDPMPELPLDNV